MSSKIDFYCLRTNKYPFLCLKTSKTLSLGEIDESKTQLFSNPFFEYILGLKVHFNEKNMELSPRFLFCKNLKKISKI